MNKIKMFLSLLKFEVVKIFRNKWLFVFLLVFPLLMTFTINSINIDYHTKTNNNPNEQILPIESNPSGYIALFVNGQLEPEEEISQIIQNHFGNQIRLVSSFDEGETLLKEWKVYFLIAIDTTAEPVKAMFYYDNSSNAGNLLANELRKEQLKYTYQSLITFLSTYGITINEDYFKLIRFEAIQDTDIQQNQRIMPLTSSFVAVIIMFGLAYTMARDNETNVIKQISYTPISTHKYLLSKAVPFIILGVIQAFLLVAVGSWVYGINYQASLLTIGGMFALFVLATTSLGLVFSCFNNQTTSTFATMISILLPILAVYLAFVNSYPLLVQWMLYLFPLSAFVQSFTQLTFNGVLVPLFAIVLCVETVAYYFVAYMLAKKKAQK